MASVLAELFSSPLIAALTVVALGAVWLALAALFSLLWPSAGPKVPPAAASPPVPAVFSPPPASIAKPPIAVKSPSPIARPAAPPPRPSPHPPEDPAAARLKEMLDRLERENRLSREELERIRSQQETDRIAHEQRLTRFRNRLERWRRFWETAVSSTEAQPNDDAAALDREAQSYQALLDAKRTKLERNLQELRRERTRVEREHEERAAAVASERRRERDQAEEKLRLLESEKRGIETELVEIQNRRAEAAAAFEREKRGIGLQVREERTRWRSRLETIRREAAEKAAAARAEAEQAVYEREKAALDGAAATERQAFAVRLADVRAERDELEKKARLEKTRWTEQLSQLSAETDGWRRKRDEAQSALDALLADHARTRAERRRWAESRFRTLERLLSEITRNADERLEKIRSEKDALEAALLRERERVRAEAEDQDRELAGRRAELDRTREKAETDQALFVADSRRREESLRAEIAALQEAVLELDKKKEIFRERESRAIRRQRERYERLVLGIQQKVDQEQVHAESRLAAQRQALEALNRRVANRRERIETLRRRRLDVLDRVFQQANTAMELVLQGLARDKGEWIHRLTTLQDEKARHLEKRERLLSAPARVSEEIRRRLREEREIYEREKERLLQSAESARSAFVDAADANRRLLENAHGAIQAAGTDLEREEKSAQEILFAARRILSQFESFRLNFTAAGPTEESGPTAASSVA